MPPLRVQSAEYRRETPAVEHVGLFGALRHGRSAPVLDILRKEYAEIPAHPL